MFNKKEYAKEYYQKNKDKIDERNRQWKKNNFERYKELKRKGQKKWIKNNPEYQKEWYLKNERYCKEYYSQWMKERYKIDLKYNLNRKISRAIYKSLKGNKKGRCWEILVSYSLDDLVKYLKKTIPNGYTWQDYLEGKLHIDHIIPISAFNFDSIENPDFKKCWNLENLRLLPAKENLRKNAKIIKPFQPALKIKERDK